nr:histidine kinase [Chitinophagaceae bacterium]
LKEELEFIHSYFYLLQIRHDDKLKLQTLSESIAETVLIPPCSLQVLVENAIKHNEFSEKNPLLIRVRLDGPYLHVSNRIRPKPYAVDSTGIGLRNLGARYKILFSKSISVKTANDEFIVKLPLLTKTDPGYQPETP